MSRNLRPSSPPASTGSVLPAVAGDSTPDGIDVSPAALRSLPPGSPVTAHAPTGKTAQAFELELHREILGAERFRATLLAVIPTVVLLALIIGRNTYPDVVASLLHGSIDIATVGYFLMAIAGFELYLVIRTARLQRKQAQASTLQRYVYAFVETSIPTAVILYYSAIEDPATALLMPTSFVYFVFILLSTLRLDFTLSVFTGAVAAIEYGAIAVLWPIYDPSSTESVVSLAHHLSKATILLVSGVSAGFVAHRLRRSFMRAIESFSEQQRILGVFGQHVSPEVVKRLVTDTEVRTQTCDVCVMFLDIRNFTAFSEGRSPAEVVDYLNVVFESTVDVIASHGGSVNKFLGDGFMAVFEANATTTNICGAAVDASREIVSRVEGLVAEGRIPPTEVGIGLHTGKAVVGNIGSAQRKEYTVIGDVVNVASRIEALNKALGTRVLASEETWLACDRPDIDAVARDAIAIRGRQQTIHVWQLA